MIERTPSASRAKTRLLKWWTKSRDESVEGDEATTEVVDDNEPTTKIVGGDEPTTESVEGDKPTTETKGRNNSNHQQPRCEEHLKENKFGWESTQKLVEAREFDGTKPKISRIQRSQNRSGIRIYERWNKEILIPE